MDLLSEARQAPAVVALPPLAEIPPAEPAGDVERSTSRSTVPHAVAGFSLAACPRIEPPLEWTLPDDWRTTLPVLRGLGVIQFHQGDWPEDERPAAPSDGSWRPPAEGGVRPLLELPSLAAAPCPKCGSPFWWQALGDKAGANLHCCECTRVAMRRMLLGLWQVIAGPDGSPRWAPWEPIHWRPFAHIEAEEEREAARLAKLNAKLNGDF